MNRRNFIKFSAVGFASSAVAEDLASVDSRNLDSPNADSTKIMSIIDLDLCDGCKGLETPLCVSACKEKNKANFPQPTHPIMDYFPQTKHEDYSKNKEDITRLTPYNWTYVESVKVANREVFVPRRCMHCDNPPCQKLYPFGVISKSKEGAVDIDKDFCFGGAKCRDACPWEIPQRQAGVGIYLKTAPKLAGGGVMYECDMRKDLLERGEKPVCEVKCPKNAIKFGKESEILERIKHDKRHIYRLEENGRTVSVYISSIKFEDINKAILEKYNNKPKMGRPHMEKVRNPLEKSANLALAVTIAPFAACLERALRR
ncbi:4Fe-4S dicluster domain-containing protein [Helicobacter sp. 16-1353]|uniref:4Fe-4S dicluster domain-containing protein n=1 Tax=Helicobacter sp. 16-1353 TaxID=2004996 RepID=UPI000DD38F58|nr:4Fe-4S dicluster domain-containing protein [Helicobacter sp. 16-1353]